MPKKYSKTVPTIIEGRRISIRKLKQTDADDIYKEVRVKGIARWTLVLPYPYPKDGAIKHIRQQQRLWRLGKAYSFAILSQETGRPIGAVAINRVDTKHQCAEVGYWLGKKYWGKGLMTEALRLLLQFGFEELKLHRIYAMAMGPNTGSRRVLEKCRFTQEGILRQAVLRYGKRQDFINYGILRTEYQKQPE
jgi:RimJ/RimL family protein N-acetyltransferase